MKTAWRQAGGHERIGSMGDTLFFLATSTPNQNTQKRSVLVFSIFERICKQASVVS